MMILVKPITFCGKPLVLACDGRCDKAWGINARPSIRISEAPGDTAYLSDGELPEAPRLVGSWEGVDTKPADYTDPARQNRWCSRECERSELIEIGEVKLPDFTGWVFNYRNRTWAGACETEKVTMPDGHYLYRHHPGEFWKWTSVRGGLATGRWFAPLYLAPVATLTGEWRGPLADDDPDLLRARQDHLGRLLP